MRPIIAILILTFLSSCSKEKTIYLKAKNAEGLKEESYLSLNGFEVGTIENITLNKQWEILIKSSIIEDIDIPIDTEFKIAEPGLLSPKIIVLSIGKSKKMISEKDTINIKTETKDSLSVDLEKLVNKFTGSDKNDSILKELKRLNENLEKQQIQKN